jgi:hypothetical protein
MEIAVSYNVRIAFWNSLLQSFPEHSAPNSASQQINPSNASMCALFFAVPLEVSAPPPPPPEQEAAMVTKVTKTKVTKTMAAKNQARPSPGRPRQRHEQTKKRATSGSVDSP